MTGLASCPVAEAMAQGGQDKYDDHPLPKSPATGCYSKGHIKHNKMDTSSFRETQQFRQVWIWQIIIGLVLLTGWAFGEQIIFGKPWGSNPGSDLILILVSLLPIGILMLFLILRLETEIDESGIYYMYFPFHVKRHKIDWETVDKAFVRKYNPFSEYGGWGIRFGHGKAHNVSGNMGLQLEFKNGKRLLIGTQKAKDIEQVLQQLTYKKKINQSS